MATLKSMKKDDLVIYAAAADAKVRELAAEVHALRMKLSMARQVAPSYRAPSAAHRSYADYVAACRRQQRASGAKVVKYLSFTQWYDQSAERGVTQ